MRDICSRSSGGRVTGFRAGLGLTVLAVAMGSGCYSYQPVESPAPSRQETVRIELTGGGQDNLERTYGLRLGRVEGRVLGQRADAWELEVQLDANRLAGMDGMSRRFVDTLSVPNADVREVEVKQFSTSRTVLTTVGSVVAAVGIYALMDATLSGEGDNGEQGSGGENFSLVPLVTGILGWLR